MKVNVYGINYEFFNGNKWAVKATVIVGGHILLNKAEFKMPYKVTSFEEAENVIRDILQKGAVE